MSCWFSNATYPETSPENDLSRAYTTNQFVKERAPKPCRCEIIRIGWRSGLGHEQFATKLAPASNTWWSQAGSNRRPSACKADALPAELWPRSDLVRLRFEALQDIGGSGWIRTTDLTLIRGAL